MSSVTLQSRWRTRTCKRRTVVLEWDQGLFEAYLKRNMWLCDSERVSKESSHWGKRCEKHHFMKHCHPGCVLPSGWFLPPSQTISFAHQTSVNKWDSALTSGRLLIRRGEGTSSWRWPLDMRKGDLSATISMTLVNHENISRGDSQELKTWQSIRWS